MIIALHAYRPIKQLCRYCRISSSGFRLLDEETVAFISGIFRGITFEFHRDYCDVKIGHMHTSLDLAGDFSTDVLIGFLTKHNVLRAGELDNQAYMA
jgi:hypothetical protein